MTNPAPGAPAFAGFLLSVSAASIFGAQIAFARLAALAGVTGVTVVVYRVALMLVVVGLLAFIARKTLGVARGETGALIVLCLASATVGTAYLSSVAYIPASVAVVILYMFPVLIVIASPVVDRVPLRAGTIVVAGLALAGVVLVVGPAYGGLDPRGLALALLAAVTAAIQFFAGTRCRRTGTLAKAMWIHLFSLPAIAIVGVLTGTLQAPDAMLAAPLAVALTISGYVVGFLLQLSALARSSAIVAGIAFCAEPVVAALSSAYFLGERLTPIQILGGLFVVAAIALNAVAAHRAGRQAGATGRTP